MREVRATVGGQRWQWREAGPAAGRTIVLLHGAGGTGAKWEQQLAPLAAAGYRVLAPDLPGHGGSDGPPRTTISGYAAAVSAWLSVTVRDVPAVVGHSMGGAIAQELVAARVPVAWLGLVGTGARLRVHPDTLARLADAEVPADFLAAGFGVRPDPELLAAEAESWRQTDAAVRIADFGACDKFDGMSRLAEISVPVLVIVGREDRLTPLKYSKHLAREIPGARLVIVEGAGHYVQLEQPARVSEALAAMAGEVWPDR